MGFQNFHRSVRSTRLDIQRTSHSQQPRGISVPQSLQSFKIRHPAFLCASSRHSVSKTDTSIASPSSNDLSCLSTKSLQQRPTCQNLFIISISPPLQLRSFSLHKIQHSSNNAWHPHPSSISARHTSTRVSRAPPTTNPVPQLPQLFSSSPADSTKRNGHLTSKYFVLGSKSRRSARRMWII